MYAGSTLPAGGRATNVASSSTGVGRQNVQQAVFDTILGAVLATNVGGERLHGAGRGDARESSETREEGNPVEGDGTVGAALQGLPGAAHGSPIVMDNGVIIGGEHVRWPAAVAGHAHAAPSPFPHQSVDEWADGGIGVGLTSGAASDEPFPGDVEPGTLVFSRLVSGVYGQGVPAMGVADEQTGPGNFTAHAQAAMEPHLWAGHGEGGRDGMLAGGRAAGAARTPLVHSALAEDVDGLHGSITDVAAELHVDGRRLATADAASGSEVRPSEIPGEAASVRNDSSGSASVSEVSEQAAAMGTSSVESRGRSSHDRGFGAVRGRWQADGSAVGTGTEAVAGAKGSSAAVGAGASAQFGTGHHGGHDTGYHFGHAAYVGATAAGGVAGGLAAESGFGATIAEQLATPLEDIVAEMVRAPVGEDNVEQVSIRLRPEFLGEVLMRISVDADGVVTARFLAEHSFVRNMIEQQLPELRALLGEHGLQLADATVAGGEAGLSWDHGPVPDRSPQRSGGAPSYAVGSAAEDFQEDHSTTHAPMTAGGIDIRV